MKQAIGWRIASIGLVLGSAGVFTACADGEAEDQSRRQEATEQRAAVIAPLTEQQIAALLDFIDGSEIAAAQAFQPKLVTAPARAYAQTLIVDHARMRQARGQIVRLGSPRTPPPRFSNLRSITHSQSATLTSLPAGVSFDATFLGIQAGNHALVVDSLRSWMAQTRDAELRGAIAAAIPVVDGHRERALRIFGALAGTAPSAPPPETARDSARSHDGPRPEQPRDSVRPEG